MFHWNGDVAGYGSRAVLWVRPQTKVHKICGVGITVLAAIDPMQIVVLHHKVGRP